MSATRHTTGWEDGQMAQVFCEGVDVGVINADTYDEPYVCGRCGATLRLIWDVRVEEVPTQNTDSSGVTSR